MASESPRGEGGAAGTCYDAELPDLCQQMMWPESFDSGRRMMWPECKGPRSAPRSAPRAPRISGSPSLAAGLALTLAHICARSLPHPTSPCARSLPHLSPRLLALRVLLLPLLPRPPLPRCPPTSSSRVRVLPAPRGRERGFARAAREGERVCPRREGGREGLPAPRERERGFARSAREAAGRRPPAAAAATPTILWTAGRRHGRMHMGCGFRAVDRPWLWMCGGGGRETRRRTGWTRPGRAPPPG
jgi:hypothetical protein